MSQQQSIVINDVEIFPGERRTVMLPMPKLYDWTPMAIPVHVINGQSNGPVLCVTAALHGDEINGVEIIRRLLKKSWLKKIKGTLIAVPIINIYGFLYQNRYLMDRRDLNRSFPGSEKGSLASRLANLVIKEILSPADYFIDLHTGSQHRSNLPQIRTDLDSLLLKKLALAFGAPVILKTKGPEGSLRQVASQREVPLILYEAGEALRFDENAIRVGLQGITNVMTHLRMTPSEVPKSTAIRSTPLIMRSSYWVRAPHSGIMRLHQLLGKFVKKGEVLATIANPVGSEEYPVNARAAGIIIGISNLPLVHAGAALFHLACFDDELPAEEDELSLQAVEDELGALAVKAEEF